MKLSDPTAGCGWNGGVLAFRPPFEASSSQGITAHQSKINHPSVNVNRKSAFSNTASPPGDKAAGPAT